MYLKWKLMPDEPLDGDTSWEVAYRGCKLTITRSEKNAYSVLVYRRDIICTAYVWGKSAFHRARKAAPKLANVMIQHAATHNESKGVIR